MNFPIPAGTNEPILPPLVADGILFVRTAGMREAPEKLLTELFREVFFEKFADSVREQQLTPGHLAEDGQFAYLVGEQAALYATRGRQKKTKRSKVKVFYGAPYPSIARHAWPRLKSDRVVRDHFLGGSLAQWFQSARDRSGKMSEFAGLYVDALLGCRSAATDQHKGTEILSAVSVNPQVTFNRETCIARLIEHFSDNSNSLLVLDSEDPLAQRIKLDFDSICMMEKQISRIQWLDVLKCYLRLALSSWLLSHMRMTVFLRSWVLEALDQGLVRSEDEILNSLKCRYRDLFHPTLTATDEVTRHVEQYMKARVELNVLLYAVAPYLDAKCMRNRLVTNNRGAGKITIVELLDLLRGIRSEFARAHAFPSATQLAIRYAENYAAWASPLRNGQGKNLREFLLVLERGGEGDTDDGYLLTPSRGGASVVFPGPMLLKTVILLADREMARARNRGKLVLSDIEQHFRQYGIEFGVTAGARPRLIAELGELGLLKGSPDAGDSAEVSAPFVFSA